MAAAGFLLLHREGQLSAHLGPAPTRRHVRGWRKETQHPQPIRWSHRNLLGGRRRVPGPTPTRHRSRAGASTMVLTMALWRSQSRPPGAREKAEDASWPATGQSQGYRGKSTLTPFDRRSAAIADAPETPGCLGSGLASKPRPGRLAGRGGRFLRAPVDSVV